MLSLPSITAPAASQPFHHGRVAIRHKILVNLGAAGGAHAARREKVFYGDGDAVQRAAVAARGQFGIGLPRARSRAASAVTVMKA